VASELDDDLLSVRQVAELFGLTDKTIRRWISKGVLPATRPGGKNLLIKRSDIVALVEGDSSSGAGAVEEQVPARTFASTAGRVVISR
jgi:excisionase family DNA binding protein